MAGFLKFGTDMRLFIWTKSASTMRKFWTYKTSMVDACYASSADIKGKWGGGGFNLNLCLKAYYFRLVMRRAQFKSYF